MNLFGYILSAYLLLLSVFPCCLVDDCRDIKNVSQQASNHQNGDEDCGNCSPFFSCEGCAHVSATIEPISFSIISLPTKSVYKGFICPFIPEIQYDFWQPPKLG